jgi:hypothetical protein
MQLPASSDREFGEVAEVLTVVLRACRPNLPEQDKPDASAPTTGTDLKHPLGRRVRAAGASFEDRQGPSASSFPRPIARRPDLESRGGRSHAKHKAGYTASPHNCDLKPNFAFERRAAQASAARQPNSGW